MEVFAEASVDLIFPTRLPQSNTLLPEHAELSERTHLLTNETAHGFLSLTHPLLHGDKDAFLDRLALLVWPGGSSRDRRTNAVRVHAGSVDVVRVRKEATHGILVPFQLDMSRMLY